MFRTYEPTRDRLVAVKVFRLDVTPEQAAALADELGRATEAGLTHPSIVEPVAAGLEGTVAYRAEEYVAAESLDVAMRHYAPASLDKALPFISQLAWAIDAARAAGVGHGALHPRDIFVTPDEARASGFGVVDALERLGLRAPVRRPYSPPERIAGQPWSTTADVFSLGAIAFELLTARRPSGLGDQMGSLVPASGPGLGPNADAIRAVLARAMHEDPDARFASAGAFASALAEAAGQTVATTSSEAAIAAESVNTVPPPIIVEHPGPDSLESLEAFTAESDSPIESPREAARKAIAARKRQVKPKLPAEKPVGLDLESIEQLEGRERESSQEEVRSEQPVMPELPPDEKPEATAAFAPVTDEQPVTEEAAVAAAASAIAEPLVAEAPGAVPLPPVVEPARGAAADAASSDLDRAAADAAPLQDLEVARASSAEREDDVVDAPIVREAHERVVAVDEFRLREAPSRPERTWPKPGERPAAEARPFNRPLGQTMIRTTERPHSPKPPDAVPLADADVPFVHADEPETERQRIAMLPLAIVLILGLLLGYGAGYAVARRDAARTAAQIAQSTPKPTTPLTTPGTSGQARAYSDQPVSPSGGQTPAAPRPVDSPSRTPPAASSARSSSADAPAGAKPPAPRPAPTKPTTSPAAVAPTTGRIVVNSSPSRAAVTINGRWTGRTPLALSDRKFGEYTIRIVQPGYEVVREAFTLSSKSPSKTFDVTLKPESNVRTPPPAPAAVPSAGLKPAGQKPAGRKPAAPATGALFVDSRPQGANVLVNGKLLGVTPLRLTDQPAGSYEVSLELADHQPWTTTTTIVGGATARVTGSMERIR